MRDNLLFGIFIGVGIFIGMLITTVFVTVPDMNKRLDKVERRVGIKFNKEFGYNGK